VSATVLNTFEELLVELALSRLGFGEDAFSAVRAAHESEEATEVEAPKYHPQSRRWE
jgi:hypothetical protein